LEEDESPASGFEAESREGRYLDQSETPTGVLLRTRTGEFGVDSGDDGESSRSPASSSRLGKDESA
jgi:hypothetical protein